MCNNGTFIVGKFNTEDVIKLRKSFAELTAVEECGKFNEKIPRKYFLRDSTADRLKSRSDSDLCPSDDYKNLGRYRDFEVSPFPSDSDITVIRVLKKSRIQGTPSRALEGILGDGSHLPESPSMVNLATLVPGIPTSGTDERLVALSSWDFPTINRTASDTTVRSTFSQLHDQASSSSLFVSDHRFYPINVVAGLSELAMMDQNSLSCSLNDRRQIRSSVITDAIFNEEISDHCNQSVTQQINILDDEIEFAKNKSLTNDVSCRREKFSARIRKTLRRMVPCSCFSAAKDKLATEDQDL